MFLETCAVLPVLRSVSDSSSRVAAFARSQRSRLSVLRAAWTMSKPLDDQGCNDSPIGGIAFVFIALRSKQVDDTEMDSDRRRKTDDRRNLHRQ